MDCKECYWGYAENWGVVKWYCAFLGPDEDMPCKKEEEE